MLYYVLDQTKKLSVVLHTTSDMICKEFNLTKKQFKTHLLNNELIDGKYIIVESEEKEDWSAIYKKGSKTYFVSSAGNFKMYDSEKKEYKRDFITVDKKGNRIVKFENMTVLLMELVAEWYSADWYAGCNVKLKNPDQKDKCCIENITVIKDDDKQHDKIGLYFNDKLTKIYADIDECCLNLKMNKNDVIAQLQGMCKTNAKTSLRYI